MEDGGFSSPWNRGCPSPTPASVSGGPEPFPKFALRCGAQGRRRHRQGPVSSAPPEAPTGPPRGRCRRERRGRAVLTPLQRGQLQVLQDELAQEPFHTRLARALQGGVGLSQGKLGSCWAPGQAEEFHKFLDRFPGGNHPQQRRALLCLRDGLTACQTPPSVQETGPASPPPELWSPEPLPRTESSERTRTQQLFLLGEMTNAAGGGGGPEYSPRLWPSATKCVSGHTQAARRLHAGSLSAVLSFLSYCAQPTVRAPHGGARAGARQAAADKETRLRNAANRTLPDTGGRPPVRFSEAAP